MCSSDLKSPVSKGEILHHLAVRGWEREDRYLCMKVGANQWDEVIMSLASACNKIEELVDASIAFSYQNNIAVIVNLTRGNHQSADCLLLLRDFLLKGLFRSGSSNVFRDFLQMGDYFRQASAALEIGGQGDRSLLIHRFEDCALQYFLRYGCSELSERLVCSEDVLALDSYDQQNRTKLCETLRVYIANNLNAAQTARALFIHRSTFFYRLDCIKAIIKSDLKDEAQRFYLQLSFLLTEGIGKERER